MVKMAGEEKASFVGDIRKLLQDVVTPDLKALVTRMDALEKEFRESKSEVKERFAEVKEQFAEVKEQFASRSSFGSCDRSSMTGTSGSSGDSIAF